MPIRWAALAMTASGERMSCDKPAARRWRMSSCMAVNSRIDSRAAQSTECSTEARSSAFSSMPFSCATPSTARLNSWYSWTIWSGLKVVMRARSPPWTAAALVLLVALALG